MGLATEAAVIEVAMTGVKEHVDGEIVAEIEVEEAIGNTKAAAVDTVVEIRVKVKILAPNQAWAKAPLQCPKAMVSASHHRTVYRLVHRTPMAISHSLVTLTAFNHINRLSSRQCYRQSIQRSPKLSPTPIIWLNIPTAMDKLILNRNSIRIILPSIHSNSTIRSTTRLSSHHPKATKQTSLSGIRNSQPIRLHLYRLLHQTYLQAHISILTSSASKLNCSHNSGSSSLLPLMVMQTSGVGTPAMTTSLSTYDRSMIVKLRVSLAT